jgi:hypothetical protein
MDGGYLRCTGGIYPAQLLYQELGDRACEKIKAAITEAMAGAYPVKAMLDPYKPGRFDRASAFRHGENGALEDRRSALPRQLRRQRPRRIRGCGI